MLWLNIVHLLVEKLNATSMKVGSSNIIQIAAFLLFYALPGLSVKLKLFGLALASLLMLMANGVVS